MPAVPRGTEEAAMSELGRDRQIEDGEASLLKLLLEDADASRLSEPLAALRSTGEDSPEVARLRQATTNQKSRL